MSFITLLVKILFLWSTSTLVVNLVVKKELSATIAGMMSWPQLATALIGGLIAYIFLKSINKI